MQITVVALGTRGDVQPMLALSKGLMRAGHSVRMIAGANFSALVQSHGVEFVPSVDMEALMKSEAGVAWTEGGDNRFKQLGMMKRLLLEHGETMVAPLVDAAAATDLFISGFVSEPFVQTVSEKYGKPYINTPLQPYRPTHSGAATMTALFPKGDSLLNLWMGYMAERMIWSIAASTTNTLRARLGLPAHTAASYTRVSRTTPTVFGFSQHVISPAPDWGGQAAISGYWFLDETAAPSPELEAFLDAGAPPVYIGFGSMSNSNPGATAALMTEALRKTGLRAIIGSGWGGARGADADRVFTVDHIPHGWLFPRVAAVVHHGGAGTTAAGLCAGKPTLIIPHMSDQPFWGRRVYELGVGVKPIPRHRLTADTLAEGLKRLVSDSQILTEAARLGEKIRAENGVETGVRLIERFTAPAR